MHNFHVLEMTSLTWIIQNYVNNPSFKWIWQIHFYEITIFNHLNTSNHLWTLNITRIKSEWVFSGRVSYTFVTAVGQLDHEYPVSKAIWGHVLEFNQFCSESFMTQFWIRSIRSIESTDVAKLRWLRRKWILGSKSLKKLGHGTLVTLVRHSFAPSDHSYTVHDRKPY